MEWTQNLPRGFLLFIAMALTVFMAFLVITLLRRHQELNQDLLSLVSLTPRAVETEVGGQGTPDYNRLIDEQNEVQAKKAEAAGTSYVPTPVGQPQEAVKEKPPLAPPEKTIAPKQPEPKKGLVMAPPAMALPPLPQPPVARPVDPLSPRPTPKVIPSPPPMANRRKAILDELKNVLASFKSPLTAPVVKTADSTRATESSGASSLEINPPLKPGEVLPAITTLAINSDVPSPAVATVTFGPHKSAKLLGSFATGEKGAVLSFNRLIPVNGRTITFEALAIDPRTNRAAIASKVEDRFFQRWGGLLASGFLEGFGAALGNRGGRVYATGDILIEERPGQTVADASLEALGQVGQKAGEVFKKEFDRPPTIHIKAGQPLGILVLSVQGVTP